jgi:hypothetical protein
VLEECRSAQLIEESRASNDVVTDALYDLASLPEVDPAQQDVVERTRTKTRNRIAQAARDSAPARSAVSLVGT